MKNYRVKFRTDSGENADIECRIKGTIAKSSAEFNQIIDQKVQDAIGDSDDFIIESVDEITDNSTSTIKIMNIEITELVPEDDRECIDGNYDEVKIVFDTGEEFEGNSCPCGNGCNRSVPYNLLSVGQEFDSMDDFYSLIKKH